MKSQKYFCHDCHELFEVHSTKKDGKPYCTGCGDHVSVRVYYDPPKKKKNYQAWTSEDLDRLKDLMNQGLKTRTIAYILDRSIDAVRLKIYRIEGEMKNVT